LTINNTDVTDLTPLQGMPLEDIRLTPKNIIKGLEILRDMKSLKTIGTGIPAWPAAEFWERYDKGSSRSSVATVAVACPCCPHGQRLASLGSEDRLDDLPLDQGGPFFASKVQITEGLLI